MEEKRKHKRLELQGEIIVKELGGKESDESFDIEITDCSRKGLGFNCSSPLMIGSIYEANLVLWNKDQIHVFVQIVRAVKNEDSFHYGGLFIGMPDSDEMRIQVYETVQEELGEKE